VYTAQLPETLALDLVAERSLLRPWGFNPSNQIPGPSCHVFRLDEDVQKTFQEPAELLVHAKIGEKQGIARAMVVSGRLQDAR
jgi:hypothetical protein